MNWSLVRFAARVPIGIVLCLVHDFSCLSLPGVLFESLVSRLICLRWAKSPHVGLCDRDGSCADAFKVRYLASVGIDVSAPVTRFIVYLETQRRHDVSSDKKCPTC